MAKLPYTSDNLSALDAQLRALEIVFGPMLFQTTRIMRKFGLLDALATPKARDGLTLDALCQAVDRPKYLVQILIESGLASGIVYRDRADAKQPQRYLLTKAGQLFDQDAMTGVLIDFMQDVCYQGLFKLEEALEAGSPEGLRFAGDWPTLYQGMTELPSPMQESWFRYDHYFSECSFDEALDIVFERPPRRILDIGGNTGKWATACVERDSEVEVTIADLPQQLQRMRQDTANHSDRKRIHGHPIDFLTNAATLPADHDVIWMSQFLDCFDEARITRILTLAASMMSPDARLYINEIFWDRQRFTSGAFVLMQSSPYFTAIANGHSKFIHFPDLRDCLDQAKLEIVDIHDHLGWGHTLVECRKRT